MREMDIPPGFEFTRFWFRNRNLPTFRQYVYPEFHARPTIYLEIGVFEGMSMVWMCHHVLTHPDSHYVGIDPWLPTTKLSKAVMGLVMARAFANAQRLEVEGRWPTLARMNSAEALRKMCGREGFLGLTKDSVDLCMIDGNHWSLAVLDDARQAFKLLKPGGWLLFDDVENDRDKGLDHVKSGVRMFVDEMGDRVRAHWKHRYMECYVKT